MLQNFAGFNFCGFFHDPKKELISLPVPPKKLFYVIAKYKKSNSRKNFTARGDCSLRCRRTKSRTIPGFSLSATQARRLLSFYFLFVAETFF